MTTITRNLTQIDGATVSAPTQTGYAATSWEVFANDAAYEAVYGAGSQGDTYFNSTELILRAHNGTAWVYLQNGINALEDSASTGASQDLDPTYHNLLKLTNASLTSVRSMDPGQTSVVYLVNGTGSSIDLFHEDGAATAANRLLLPDSTTFTLEDGNTAHFVYDSLASRFRYTNETGSGGSGVGGKNYILNTDADVDTSNVTTSATGGGSFTFARTTTAAELPEETKTTGFKASGTGLTVGDYIAWAIEATGIDDADGNLMGSARAAVKDISGAINGDWKIQVYNVTQSAYVGTEVNLTGDGVFYLDVPFVATEDYEFRLITLVAAPSAVGLSGVTIEPVSQVRASLGGWKQYDETDVTITSSATSFSPLGRFVPYKDPMTGIWRMVFSIEAESHSSETNYTVTVGGVTFDTAMKQAVALAESAGTVACRAYTIDGSSSSIAIASGSGITSTYLSGDVALDSKPTWADYDNTALTASDFLYSNARASSTGFSAGNTIITSTYVTLNEWNTLVTEGGMTSDSTNITVPADGWYRVESQVVVNSGSFSSTFLGLQVQVNGVVVKDKGKVSGVSEAYPTISIYWEGPVNANEDISINARQDSGGNLGFLSAVKYATFTCTRLSDTTSRTASFPFATDSDYGLVKGAKVPGTDASVSTATGFIGESITASLGDVNLSVSGTAYTFGSIALTAGIWLVQGNFNFSANGGSSRAEAALSLNTAASYSGIYATKIETTNVSLSTTLPNSRVFVSSGAFTAYAVGYLSYTGGSPIFDASESNMQAIRIG